MNLELMRLSMWPRDDISAEVAIGPRGRPIQKIEWLRGSFRRQIVFDYKGREYHFVPTQDEIEEPFIAGRIGLLGSVRENEPPEAGLIETVRDRWKAIVVIVDPRAEGDGQRAAVEYGTGVAKPYPIFSALVKHLNKETPPSPYVIEVRPISASDDFWSFVRRNEGHVTSASFEFLAPNMFGIQSDMDKEADELKRNERARRASITIQNDGGLNLETARVRNTVEYTSRGGGAIKATARNERFDSSKKVSRVTVPDEIETGDEVVQPATLRSRIARAIAYVFKRTQ